MGAGISTLVWVAVFKKIVQAVPISAVQDFFFVDWAQIQGFWLQFCQAGSPPMQFQLRTKTRVDPCKNPRKLVWKKLDWTILEYNGQGEENNSSFTSWRRVRL
jgi:hypothetical protein